MIIKDYTVEVFTPPCDPGAARFSAIVHVGADLQPLLPYLNAELPGAVYNRTAPALSWKMGRHAVVFHPDRIAISSLQDRQDALRVAGEVAERANAIWARRDQVVPSYEARQKPTVMALYKLLPATNCRQCGQPTCWQFALHLAAGQAQVESCTPLQEAANAGRLRSLDQLLALMPT